MAPTRRAFIKITGFSALGLALSPLMGMTAVLPPGTATAGLGARQPLTGKRWAMVIDPARCRPGCTDCVTACHEAHNVPSFGNPKDDIHWIALDKVAHAFPAGAHDRLPEAVKQRPLPVLCNHCDNPPCVRVCPTQATFRRADGIVMMDYHRCIGCRFCVAACPYGARSMNWRDPRPAIGKLNPTYPTRTKGVVEKCNFCEERLAQGRLPACVTACSQKALAFGDLEDPQSEVRRLLDTRFSLRRRSELGTEPQVYYLL